MEVSQCHEYSNSSLVLSRPGSPGVLQTINEFSSITPRGGRRTLNSYPSLFSCGNQTIHSTSPSLSSSQVSKRIEGKICFQPFMPVHYLAKSAQSYCYLTLTECKSQISNDFIIGLTDTTEFATKLFPFPSIQLSERKEEGKTNFEA